MNGKPVPFPVPAGVPVIGQPFTITAMGVPMNVALTCNCGGLETAVVITLSTPAACPSCSKVYNAVFNPTTGKVELAIRPPTPEQVPS